RRIGTSEEENLLHDRGGIDIKLEQSFYLNNPIAKLFFDLFPDPLFGRGAVQLPGAGLQRMMLSQTSDARLAGDMRTAPSCVPRHYPTMPPQQRAAPRRRQ